MQGATCTPPPSAGEPPTHQNHVKTTEPKTEAKVESIKAEDSDSEYEEQHRAMKRPASTDSFNPEYKRIARLSCHECNISFDSDREFHLHIFTTHSRNQLSELIDCSSRKFPTLNQSNGLRTPLNCKVCHIELPCEEARDIHERICESNHGNHIVRNNREDFFAKLDLRNRFGSTGNLTPPMERFIKKDCMTDANGNRDLADIQSILNVTGAGGLLERLTRSADSATLTPPDSASRNSHESEEAQDKFAAEFRKMKMRGEFPCRLCPAKFPNLRALKGHNRVHLSGAGPGPYRCNMCPHISLDKAALVRHMRTHNGDRPYECAICNYAFTTKANCERHLRNRHAKVTREDVKRSIIYHPSEDPNNDESTRSNREETKRALSFSTPEPDRPEEQLSGRVTPLSHFTNTAIDRRQLIITTTPPHVPIKHVLPETPDTTPRDDEDRPRIKVKGIGRLTLAPELLLAQSAFMNQDVKEELDQDMEDEPVDLSTSDNNDDCDALDLSKKKRDSDEENSPKFDNVQPRHELTPAALAAAFEKTQQMILAQRQLLEGRLPKLDNAFYASQLYGGTIPGLPLHPAFPIHPYLLRHPFFAPADLAEAKERIQKDLIRGLHLSGGGIVHPPEPVIRSPVEQPKPEPQVAPAPLRSESPPPRPPTNDSVKMVIKNGILMPKQKQRRYRTERPFSCSQCSARFTLRSNMERHVKQQHPAHWSVRSRGSQGPMMNQSPSVAPESLAERVKFALLARQLETHSSNMSPPPQRRDSDEVADNEEEDEDALIIDEEESGIEGARRAAQEALMASVRQQELARDIELRIAGSLISKPQPSMLPQQSVHSNEEEDDEEGLVASTSEGNFSGSDENKSESDAGGLPQPEKKKSAYSLAPNRVSCPYCHRKFPWSSSLRRHVLTHTGQKPFKCAHCPLLFTTKSNCDRHLARKHSGAKVRPTPIPVAPPTPPPAQSPPEDDAAFKCHLCEASFSAREPTLSHIANEHSTEYELLVSKGALDASPSRESESTSDDSIRLPDYANRKVVCAFCVRRFWSAEDLRRHVRTHSGERPFACDLCRRRFTLKHSMLRHRKKHRSGEEVTATEDESPAQSPQYTGGINNNNSPPTHKESSGDLIGDLLGISDRRVLNQLLSSADRAAEILGVDQ